MRCGVVGCEQDQHAKGFCSTHYRRWRKHGTADADRPIMKMGRRLKWIERHVSFDREECLRWPFSKWPRGHVSTVKFRGKLVAATRIMCELANGDPPDDDSEAAHSCGNGHDGCINPKHLRWATHRQNMADAIAHGTATRGDKNGRAKLTKDQVAEIRQLPGSHTAIAKRFDVHLSTIARIRSGKRWVDVR